MPPQKGDEGMKTCTQCGEPLEKEAAVCPSCGAPTGGTTASLTPVPAPERELSGEVPHAEGPVLVVRKGPDVGETFYLDRPQLTIGRDPECDIFLNDVTVSRRHATLTVGDDGVTVADTDSLNGTYVNGELVEHAVLRTGDALQIGRFQLFFIAGGGR